MAANEPAPMSVDASDPDGGGPEAAAEEEVLPELSLEIFNVIKSSHAQHGLRHGDYVRYRQYCTRRLRRLRKSVGLLYGKGRFVKKPLEPQMVRDSTHLMVPLYAAERAWSYAMAIKRENTAQEMRPHHHSQSRLIKAAKWSRTLSQLCASRGDKRTALEAEAYCGFMVGNMHLEREQWAQALTHLRRTRTICTELCRVSTSDQVHLYKQVTEEVDPSIRFCAYNLRRDDPTAAGAEEDGDDSGMADLLGGLDGGGEGASDILRSKLEAVLQENRSRQAQSLADVEILGERVPIKSDKVRIAILSADQKALEIEALPVGTDGLMEKYDELFVAFNDALEGVRTDLRAAAKEQSARSGVTEKSLTLLQAYLTWRKLDRTVARTMLLVEQTKRALASGGVGAGASGGGGGSGTGSGKRASPEDVVRLYDSAISSLQEMAQLEGYREEATLMEQLDARQAAAKACRCFYLAESYGAATRFPQAQALYARAAELMVDAVGMLKDSGHTDSGPDASSELAALSHLESLIDGAKARAHARAFVDSLDGGETVAEAEGALGGLGLSASGTAKKRGELPLADSPEVFSRAHPDHLVPFPPNFVTVPCKPLLFDIARNQIAPPDLTSRKAKQRAGWGSYLFGRGNK